MYQTIKTRVLDINNQVRMGISRSQYPVYTHYFVETTNPKKEVERFYVDKDEFNSLSLIAQEKIGIVEKLRIKKKRDNKKLKARKIKYKAKE